MTIKELLRLYVRHRILRPETVKTYEYVVNSVVGHHGGDPPLDALDEEWWVAYREAQLRAARPITFNSKRRRLLDFAVERGAVSKNYLRGVARAPIPSKPKRAIPEPTLSRAIEFLRAEAPGVAVPVIVELRWFWLAVVQTLYV